MKKILSLLLAAVLLVSLAACGGTESKEPAPASALEILEKVWGSYADDEKFPCGGGSGETMQMDAPGALDITDTDTLTFQYLVPADQTANVTDGASLIHGMLTNHFTCGVFKVADAAAFAETMHNVVSSNQWMCGMPEALLIATIADQYVLVAFGLNDLMGTFEAKLTGAYAGAKLVYDEVIAG